MAFQTVAYDMFALYGKPYRDAYFTSETPSVRYPLGLGPVIEPILFETRNKGLIVKGDTAIIDGTSWTITGMSEGTAGCTSGDSYINPYAPYARLDFGFMTLSDGTAERYLGVPYDYNMSALVDAEGNVAPLTHFWLENLIDIGHVYSSQVATDNDFRTGATGGTVGGAVCFAAGSMIETARGPRPVQSLRPGDLVMTRDNGLQPLRWIGGRLLGAAELAAAPNLLPVRIAAGALGPGCPAQDLTVSPQHRVLLRSPIAARMAGSAEVLVAAVQLVGMPGITRCGAKGGVGYWHLMFDRHEIVFANGAESESLYLGRMALQALSPSARAELRALFPDLMRGAEGDPRPLARPVMRGAPVRKLLERQLRHGKPLVAAG